MKITLKTNKWQTWKPEFAEKMVINQLIYITLFAFFFLAKFSIGIWICLTGDYFWLITMIISYNKYKQETEANQCQAQKNLNDK